MARTSPAGENDAVLSEAKESGLAREVSCRRCGKAYLLEGGASSCPHCDVSHRPLIRGLRSNANAAVLAIAALPVLAVGVFLPFISMTALGRTSAYSLLGAIQSLYQRGGSNTFLAMVLLLFSVLFPFAKLLAILMATSRFVRLSDRTRVRLHHLANITGRYSLLDILVVAITIVVVKVDGMAEAKALVGTYLFATAVFLSMVAGVCVNFDEPKHRHR